MRKTLQKIGSLPIMLVLVSAALFAASAVVTNTAGCTYDDVPNVWSCAQSWATPIMGYFDPLMFVVAYPALILALIVALFRVVRRG